MADQTWKQFSTNVLRSLPKGATFSDRGRALRAASKMWHLDHDARRTTVRMRRNPIGYGHWREQSTMSTGISRSTLMYAIGAAAVYFLVFRGTAHTWFPTAPQAKG